MTAAAPDAPAQGAPPARDGRPLTLLVFSSLYPNPVEPHHGIFVANRLQRWLERHGGRAEVVAPVPLAPPVGDIQGKRCAERRIALSSAMRPAPNPRDYRESIGPNAARVVRHANQSVFIVRD